MRKRQKRKLLRKETKMATTSFQDSQALLGDLLLNTASSRSRKGSNNPVRTTDTTITVTEYNALRSTVIKRLEFRYQILNLILIVAGTFLTIGLQKDNPSSILLVYPILALFLTAIWTHNGIIIAQIEI